jgi:hypothetical protein
VKPPELGGFLVEWMHLSEVFNMFVENVVEKGQTEDVSDSVS